MLLAGANFVLHHRLLFLSKLEYHRDEEFRYYLIAILASILLVFAILLSRGESVQRSLIHSSFQVVSIMTTTGFTTSDFNSWPSGAKMTLFILMFIGGCAGSTAGGLKVVRVLSLLKYAFLNLKKGVHPRGIFPIKIGEKVLEEGDISSIIGFTILYFLLFLFSSLILSILGYDLVTSLSAVAACIGNVGPGLGLVAPSGSYAILHPLAKLVLSFDMIAGRLEILPVLILLYPKFTSPYTLRSSMFTSFRALKMLEISSSPISMNFSFMK